MDQSNSTNSTSLIVIAAMLELHVSNWQELIMQLQAEKAPADQIAYCQAQVNQLEGEASRISESKSF